MNRFNAIDFYKCICASLVVMIHTQYPYKDYILPITTIAVPSFFCISGFFAWNSLQKVDRIKRIFNLLLWTLGIYYLKTVIVTLISSNSLYIPSIKDVVDFILYNDVVFANHLWYIASYLYVLLIVFFLGKRCLNTIYLLVFSAIVHWLTFSEGLHEHFYRNSILQGLPYFSIGCLLRSFFDKGWILRINGISSILLCAIIVVVIYSSPHINKTSLFSFLYYDIIRLLSVVFIFIYVIKRDSMSENLFSKIGKDYSLYIYVFHPLPMVVVQVIINKLDGTFGYIISLLNPFIIITLCIVVVKFLKNRKLIPF